MMSVTQQRLQKVSQVSRLAFFSIFVSSFTLNLALSRSLSLSLSLSLLIQHFYSTSFDSELLSSISISLLLNIYTIFKMPENGQFCIRTGTEIRISISLRYVLCDIK